VTRSAFDMPAQAKAKAKGHGALIARVTVDGGDPGRSDVGA
jgi:hypothetical protein